MKKASLFVWVLAGSFMAGHSQNSSAWLDVNRIRSQVFPKNNLFFDGVQNPNYEVPAGYGMHTLFLGNLWLVGKDAGGQYHGYYNRYGSGDTIPGPLTLGAGVTTQAIADPYKRVWKINQWEIDLLRQAQSNGQLASGAYVPPPDIAQWPANPPAAGYGNNLAPYHDQNGDNEYDILDGDYPIIKGEQMLYFILNDRGTTYESALFDSLPPSDIPLQTGLEIHVSVYACKKEGAGDSTDIMNYTSFVEYDIYNRGTIPLSDLYMGFNADADIGFASDDYTGSHVTENAFYFYNGDEEDAPPGTSAGPGQYGVDAPVQSIQFLENQSALPRMGSYMSYNSYYYFGLADTGNMREPETAQQFYNYLTSRWKDGSHLLYGGIGYAGYGTLSGGVTSTATRYAFPGDSDPGFSGTGGTDPGFLWSESSPCPICSPAVLADRQGIGSTGPFTLLPGGNLKLTLGLITTFDSTSTIAQRIEKNREQNKWLKQWYDNGDLPCVMSTAPLSVPGVLPVSLDVYPNPAGNRIRVSGAAVHAGTAYELVDIHGRTLRTGNSLQEGTLEVDVHDLSDGIYFIRLHENGQSQTVKFIKQQ